MVKQLAPAISRNVLYDGNAIAARAKFEAAHVPLRQIPLEKVVEMYFAGTVDPIVLEQKAIDTAVEGAEFINIVDKIATFVPMESEIVLKKVRGYTSFKDFTGITGVKVKNAGGYVDAVKLDCSNGKGMHRVEVAFEKFNKQTAGELANAIREAGQVMMDEMARLLFVDYLADVDSTMTNTKANWGNSYYKSLLKAVSLIAGQKMHPDFAVIGTANIYDLGSEDYFIHAQYKDKAGETSFGNAEKGTFGTMLPNNMPIYYHYGMTSGSMLVGTKAKSMFYGVYQPLTIENFDDVINGKEGAVLTMQYDYKNGSNAQKTKPTAKSWATVTSA